MSESSPFVRVETLRIGGEPNRPELCHDANLQVLGFGMSGRTGHGPPRIALQFHRADGSPIVIAITPANLRDQLKHLHNALDMIVIATAREDADAGENDPVRVEQAKAELDAAGGFEGLEPIGPQGRGGA